MAANKRTRSVGVLYPIREDIASEEGISLRSADAYAVAKSASRRVSANDSPPVPTRVAPVLMLPLDTLIDRDAQFRNVLVALTNVERERLLEEAYGIADLHPVVDGQCIHFALYPTYHVEWREPALVSPKGSGQDALVTQRRAALWQHAGRSALASLFAQGHIPGGWILYGDTGTLTSIPDELFATNLKQGLYECSPRETETESEVVC